MLTKFDYIKLVFASLLALTAAYSAIKVGVRFTHGNEPLLSPEAKTVLALREWLVMIDASKTEVSDVSYWALVELFLTLEPLGMQDQAPDQNAVWTPPLVGEGRATVCANVALAEPHRSEVISRLNEASDVELRTEDPAGSQYGVLGHYEECDVMLLLQHTALENYNGMVFDVIFGYNHFCLGWQVVYPRNLAWRDAPNLHRQRTLIC